MYHTECAYTYIYIYINYIYIYSLSGIKNLIKVILLFRYLTLFHSGKVINIWNSLSDENKINLI